MVTPFLIKNDAYKNSVYGILARRQYCEAIIFLFADCASDSGVFLYTKIPRNTFYSIPGRINWLSAVPPALRKNETAQALPEILSPLLCVTCMDVLTYLLSSAYSAARQTFNQSAPECSLYLLFPMALSVGDAIFLSASENKSLLHRFSLLMF